MLATRAVLGWPVTWAKPARCEDELEDERLPNSSGTDSREWQKIPISSGLGGGGAERDRTADLLIANEALSQLSYGPKVEAQRFWARCAGIRAAI